ncbi:MAG TPA: hypothetical protein VF574_17575 [Allosphingosinicella sp.]|jgi:hypothetical protein
MSIFKGLSGLAAILSAAAPASPAQQRQVVIEFQGRMCTTIDPSYESSFRCDPTRQKLVTLGNKVLWYDSADRPEGVVFVVGSLIDLTSDPDNRFRPAPGLGVTRESRTAYAGWNGNILNLSMQAEGFNKKNKRVYSYKHEFSVGLGAGDRCDILSWYQGGYTGYKANTLFFRLKDATCRMRPR